MNSLLALYLLLWGLLLIEGIVIVPRGRFAAIAEPWGAVRWLEGEQLFQLGGRGFSLLWPLPTLGAFYRSGEMESTAGSKRSARQIAAGARLLRPLRINSVLLFLYLYLLLPLWSRRLSLERYWPWLLALLLISMATAAILFWRAHSRLFPEARSDRTARLIAIALSPAAAIRAADQITARQFEQLHPLALAAALAPDAAAALARRALYDSPGAATRKLLSGCGLDPDKIGAPPERTDPRCDRYCPRCAALYIGAERCEDCAARGVLTVPFG